jgi:hypothetical protein
MQVPLTLFAQSGRHRTPYDKPYRNFNNNCGELQPDVFREGIFDNVFKILQQVCGLDFDSFTFQSAREREHLTDNIRATFCTYLCC